MTNDAGRASPLFKVSSVRKKNLPKKRKKKRKTQRRELVMELSIIRGKIALKGVVIM